MLESRRLRHFLAVYDQGSIGRAAEKLLLTQPALSKSIRLLEDNLGVSLFERTTLGVVPTVFGNALALHAKAIAAQARHAEAQIANLRGIASGRVSIGVGPSVAVTLMPLATERIRELDLDVELSVTEGLVDEIIPALRRGEIDLAVGSWPKIVEPAFHTEVLATDRIMVFARREHPLQGRRVEASELLEHRWALPPSSQWWLQQLDDQFFTRGLSAPKPAVVTNSASYLKRLLVDQNYLSFLPTHLVAADGLSAIDVDFPVFTADVSLTYKERSLTDSACISVVELLRDAAARLSNPPEPFRAAA